jgi:hypothetical protein
VPITSRVQSEKPSSRSRTKNSEILSRFGGVAYGLKPLFFEPLTEPNLNLSECTGGQSRAVAKALLFFGRQFRRLTHPSARKRIVPAYASVLARTDFPPVLYNMSAPHALGLVPSRVFLLYRGDNRNRATLLKTAPSWVSAKALVNHRPTAFTLG